MAVRAVSSVCVCVAGIAEALTLLAHSTLLPARKIKGVRKGCFQAGQTPPFPLHLVVVCSVDASGVFVHFPE